MENLPEGISVSMSSALGPLLSNSPIKRLEVDFELLVKTLQDLGEESPENTLPLDINISPIAKYGDESTTLGSARLVADDKGLPLARKVDVALLEFKAIDERTANYTLDLPRVNSTLLHELQHSVDYTRNEVVSQEEKHIEKVKRKFLVKSLYYRLGALGLAGSGGLVTLAGVKTNSSYLTGAGLAVAASGLLIRNPSQAKTREWLNKNAYHKSPFEMRAKGLVDFATQNNLVPEILKAYEE